MTTKIDTDEIEIDKLTSAFFYLFTNTNNNIPNLEKVTLRPWGAKEFAIVDNQLGMRFQQW